MSRRPFSKTRRRTTGVEVLEQRLALAAVLSLEGPTDLVLEGEQAAFTLRLSEATRRAEAVFIATRPGTATLGVDYAAPAQVQINFAPGETVKRFSIATLSEAVPRREGYETFFVTARPANPQLSGTLTRQVTIGDSVAKPTLSIGDIRVMEGGSGTVPATFTLSLTSAFPRAVTVAYATRDGSATLNDNDYAASQGTVTFAPGQTTQTVTVNVNGDRRLETDETFSLVLSTPTNTTLGRALAICTIVNDEADLPGYQITLVYDDPNLPAAQKAVFERAVTRLQQIIVGDVPGVATTGGEFVDDMQISVFVEAMPDMYNGYAMATAWRPGTGGLPYDGEIHINQSRIGNPGIYHTIIHEILHSIGFYDRFFTETGTATGLTTNQPLFTGANARREYGTYFGIASPTGVPLYGNQAQQGSYGSHWDTAAIGTEIMSVGWDTTSTALRPFSRITVGALQDLGYQVNYAAADRYRRPDTAPDGGTGTGRPTGPSPMSRPIPVRRLPASASLPSGAKTDSAMSEVRQSLQRLTSDAAASPSLPPRAILAAVAGFAPVDAAASPRKSSAAKAVASLPSR